MFITSSSAISESLPPESRDHLFDAPNPKRDWFIQASLCQLFANTPNCGQASVPNALPPKPYLPFRWVSEGYLCSFWRSCITNTKGDMKRIIVIAGTVLLLSAYGAQSQSGGAGTDGAGGAGTGSSGTGTGGTGGAGVGGGASTAPNQGSVNQPSGTLPGTTAQPGLGAGQTPGLGIGSNSFAGTNAFGLGSNSFGLGTNSFGTNMVPMSPTGRTNSSSSIFGTNNPGTTPR